MTKLSICDMCNLKELHERIPVLHAHSYEITSYADSTITVQYHK